MQWFHVRVICLVIALIKHIPTVDVWVKCVLENACCQLYFSGTLAQKAILYSENLFKTYSTFPYNFFWRKILIKPKLIALFHFILKFLFKFDSYGEMHFSFWSLLIFSSFSLCRKKREKIGKMRNTHTWKIQESTRAIFLMILILSKTKRNFFFCICLPGEEINMSKYSTFSGFWFMKNSFRVGREGENWERKSKKEITG